MEIASAKESAYFDRQYNKLKLPFRYHFYHKKIIYHPAQMFVWLQSIVTTDSIVSWNGGSGGICLTIYAAAQVILIQRE